MASRRCGARMPIVSRATRCTTSTMRRERPKQITRRSRATSSAIIAAASASADARSPVSGSSSVGFHRATVRSGRAAPSPLDDLDQVAHQLRHHLGRVRHRRRCEQELRRRADRRADAAQTADHVGDVRAEHAPVDVCLVDHDMRQVREHVAPPVGVRADADVQHVGVRQQQVRVPARHRAGRVVGVAVVQRRPERAAQMQRLQRPRLVLGQRLRRRQVQAHGHGDLRAAPRSPAGRTRASCRWPCP